MNENNYVFESEELIKLALNEDIKNGDITTTACIEESKTCKGKLVAKESGIIAGLKIFEFVFKLFDGKGIEVKNYFNDGDSVNKGEIILEFSGNMRTVLSSERTALNFIQRMSGVATKTRDYVNLLSGTNTKLLDTRKTLPGFRLLDKYAVSKGGGKNHRIGLFDLVMLKENHIKGAGSIKDAVKQVKDKYKSDFRIEVETRNISEVEEAINQNVDIIMLDNMSVAEMKDAVKIIGNRAKTEASGNITVKNIRDVAETGVDYISVGAITHSVSALDISLLII